VAFDELAVDTSHVHLPQVHPGPLPLVNPADSAEHLLPHRRQLERLHGVAAYPGNQPGTAFPGGVGQLGGPAHLGQHAEQPPRLVVAVDPGPARDEVGSDVPAADLLVLDPQFTQPRPFPLPRPVLDVAEAAADLARARAAQAEAQRLPVGTVRERGQQRSGLPLPAERRAHVVGPRPGHGRHF